MHSLLCVVWYRHIIPYHVTHHRVRLSVLSKITELSYLCSSNIFQSVHHEILCTWYLILDTAANHRPEIRVQRFEFTRAASQAHTHHSHSIRGGRKRRRSVQETGNVFFKSVCGVQKRIGWRGKPCIPCVELTAKSLKSCYSSWPTVTAIPVMFGETASLPTICVGLPLSLSNLLPPILPFPSYFHRFHLLFLFALSLSLSSPSSSPLSFIILSLRWVATPSSCCRWSRICN